MAATRRTQLNLQLAAPTAKTPGLKIEGLRDCVFTRIDSPVESKVTAQRDVAPSKERSVTLQPDNSGRETKPSRIAACPSEKSPLSAGTADVVAEEIEHPN